MSVWIPRDLSEIKPSSFSKSSRFPKREKSEAEVDPYYRYQTTGIPDNRYTRLQVCQTTGIPDYTYTRLQVYQTTNIQDYRYQTTGIPDYRYTRLQVSQNNDFFGLMFSPDFSGFKFL